MRPARKLAPALFAALALAGCGGGSNPFDNPPEVENPLDTTGQKLSFAYFQKCINPILLARLEIRQNGQLSVNTCAASGCHDNANGTGGALRVVPSAAPVDLADAAGQADAIRAGDMYKNYYSAQGSTVIGSPTQSRLLAKPLLLNMLHGGGLIFESEQDANVQRIRYWISRPVPQGQDEFGDASHAMFTPPDPATGECNTQ